jgi:site-specific recombinase XerD
MTNKKVSGLCIPIKEGIEQFLLDLEIANRSPRTIAANRCTLGYMADYAGDNDWPDLSGVGKLHLRRYMVYLKGRPRWFGERAVDPRPISDSYYATNYRRIKRFFGWCVSEGFMGENPLADIPNPREGTRVIPVVEDQDFADMLGLLDPSLFSSPARKFRAVRDRTVLWLLADTPGRREELGALTVDDVDLSRRRIRVDGKGRKQRYMYMGSVTLKEMLRYRAFRDALHPAGPGWWVDSQGNGMHPDWLYRMLKRLARRAGVEGMHPHRFRHTFAVKALMAGIPTTTVEVMGGWERIPRTYVATLGDVAVMEAHQRLSPADQLAKRRPS